MGTIRIVGKTVVIEVTPCRERTTCCGRLVEGELAERCRSCNALVSRVATMELTTGKETIAINFHNN